MSLLLDVTVKVSVVLFVALATALLLWKSSAAVRHRVLAVGLLVAAVVPVIATIAPSWHTTQSEIVPVFINLPVESSAPSPVIDVRAESVAPYTFEDLR